MGVIAFHYVAHHDLSLITHWVALSDSNRPCYTEPLTVAPPLLPYGATRRAA